MQQEHQKLKNDKGAVATEKQDKASLADPIKENQERFSSENNRLMIGAKSLMSALNQELKLGGKLDFQSSLSESFSMKIESGSILDKIKVEPINFDFEKVAKNVMDFVGKVIMGAKSGGASDEKLEELIAQARKGVDTGFEQARKELGDMDMLSDDVKAGMDKSYGLIKQGIDDIEGALFGQLANGTQSNVSNIVSRDLGLQETEQGNISIKTLEGDDIKISFGSSTSLAQSQSVEEDGYLSQTSYSRSQSFSIEVNGDLNDDELKAINSLVTDMSNLADEFFNGDVQKAFEQASNLGFDASQIAQFSLDFKEVKQVAVREHYAPSQAKSPIATIAPYMKDLNDVMTNGQSLFSQDNLKQLMQDVAQEQLTMMDDLLAKSAIDFSTFNQQLTDAQEKTS